MTESITIGKRCRHTLVPVRIKDRRIRMRCTGCGKEWLRPSKACPTCEENSLKKRHARISFSKLYLETKADSGQEAADALEPPEWWAWEPGCDDEQCFQGRILLKRSECCCRMDVTKCDGCRNATSSTHVCLRRTPEEVDHDLAMAMLPPVKAGKPMSKELRAKVAHLEGGQGIRAPKYPD